MKGVLHPDDARRAVDHGRRGRHRLQPRRPPARRGPRGARRPAARRRRGRRPDDRPVRQRHPPRGGRLQGHGARGAVRAAGPALLLRPRRRRRAGRARRAGEPDRRHRPDARPGRVLLVRGDRSGRTWSRSRTPQRFPSSEGGSVPTIPGHSRNMFQTSQRHRTSADGEAGVGERGRPDAQDQRRADEQARDHDPDRQGVAGAGELAHQAARSAGGRTGRSARRA